MKRLACFLLTVALALGLGGCARVDKTLRIDDGRWILKSAYYTKQDAMTLIACEDGHPITDADTQAEIVDCVLSAGDGGFVIEDSTSGKSYIGEYRKGDYYGGTIAYDVFTNNSSGVAVTGMTTYADGSEERTLTLYFGYYLLNFYKE